MILLLFWKFGFLQSAKTKKKTHRDILSAYLKSLNCCAYQICLRWQWKIYNNLYAWHVWYWHTTHIQITSAQLEYPWESANENYGILQCSGAYDFSCSCFCLTWSSAFIQKVFLNSLPSGVRARLCNKLHICLQHSKPQYLFQIHCHYHLLSSQVILSINSPHQFTLMLSTCCQKY